MKNWRIGHLVNAVLLIGTVIGILQPAWSSDIGLTQIVLSLFHPSWSQEFLMRWLLVLAFLALSYSAFIFMLFRNVPITIISTELIVDFGPNGSAVVRRKQLLRANQPNVTAYFSSHGPSNHSGRVIRDQIRASIFCHEWQCTETIELRGSENTKFEVLHIFNRPLPYKWYMPLFPSWILNRDPNRLFKFLRRNVIVRTQEVAYLHEFDGPYPIMNFTYARRYQHFNLSLTLNFPVGIPPNFKAREIRNNGVTDVQFEQANNTCIIVRVDKVGAATLRVTWDNPQADPAAESARRVIHS